MKNYLFLIVCIFNAARIFAQDLENNPTIDRSVYIGVNLGAAAQIYFPLAKRDYTYETQYVKLQYQHPLWERKKWFFDLMVEPGYYRAKHRLTNIFFIKPGDAPNVQELRDRFSKTRGFYELALNIGLKATYKTDSNWLPYALLSSGPMISSIDSEHLDKGFAFSDVLAVGTQYQVGTTSRIDIRYVLRHNSSAGINSPNFGHNSGGIELGFVFAY